MNVHSLLIDVNDEKDVPIIVHFEPLSPADFEWKLDINALREQNRLHLISALDIDDVCDAVVARMKHELDYAWSARN